MQALKKSYHNLTNFHFNHSPKISFKNSTNGCKDFCYFSLVLQIKFSALREFVSREIQWSMLKFSCEKHFLIQSTAN